MRSQLVPELSTLDDLERPIYALCCRNDASFGAHCTNLNEDRPIHAATEM